MGYTKAGRLKVCRPILLLLQNSSIEGIFGSSDRSLVISALAGVYLFSTGLEFIKISLKMKLSTLYIGVNNF